MKKHLVNLLLEEFKQQAFFDEMDKLGVHFSKGVIVKNWDIVLDIIGFPKDNTLEYDWDYINSSGELRDSKKQLPDDDLFCRDWLINNYCEVTNNIAKDQKIFVTDQGLRIEEYVQEEKIKDRLAEHIDWLYDEYRKFINGEFDR